MKKFFDLGFRSNAHFGMTIFFQLRNGNIKIDTANFIEQRGSQIHIKLSFYFTLCFTFIRIKSLKKNIMSLSSHEGVAFSDHIFL